MRLINKLLINTANSIRILCVTRWTSHIKLSGTLIFHTEPPSKFAPYDLYSNCVLILPFFVGKPFLDCFLKTTKITLVVKILSDPKRPMHACLVFTNFAKILVYRTFRTMQFFP